MKLLMTSDLHIHFWSLKSTYDEFGIPSRLSLYIHLANDILTIAKNNKVDAIVIAGDLVHTPTVRPEVGNIAKEFLSILSSDPSISLIVTLGQHDLSTKTSTEYSKLHTIITPVISSSSNTYYCLGEEYFSINGTTFHVSPWTSPTFSNFKPADVFIGHGIVDGCSLPNGRVLSGGFNKSSLFSNYKLSIIGDIHKRNLWTEKDRYIVQPGTPIQNTYGDYPDCGVWICELGQEPEFISNYEFEHSDSYYDFIYVSEFKPPEEYRRKNTFPKLLSYKVDKIQESNDVVSTYSLNETFNLVNKDSEYSDIEEDFLLLYKESLATSNTVLPNESNLKSIKIKNFMSISDIEFSFDSWDTLLINGPNGSGKSSIFQAVFFCLTGETSKKLTIDNVVKYGETHMYLELVFTQDEKEFIVVRERKDRASDLSITINGVSFKKNTIAETQQLLYEILGVKKDELFLFSYFDSLSYQSFAQLTDQQKYVVVSKLSSTDILDSMRLILKDKLTSLTKEASSIQFYLNRLSEDYDKKTKLLEELKTPTNSLDRRPLDEIYKDLELIDLELSKLESEKLELKSKVDFQSNLTTSINYCNNELKTLKSQYLNLVEKKKALTNQLCSECGQHYAPSNLVELLSSLDEKIGSILTNSKSLVSKVKDLESKKVELKLDNSKFVNIPSLINKKSLLKSELTKSMSITDPSAKIYSITSELEEISNKSNEFSSKLSVVNSTLVKMKKLEKLVSRDGVLAKSLLQNSIDLLNIELTNILSFSDVSVKISNDKSYQVKVKLKNEQETLFNNLSNGERKLVEISLIIAFINVYSKIFKLNKSILGYVFFDELFTYLDQSNIQVCKEILEDCKASKLIITHESELKSYFTSTMQLTKSSSGTILMGD